jgi:ABC-type phosphate transport system auxiliary subunit
MFGGKKRYGWWHPFVWISAAIVSVVAIFVIGKILLVLAFLSGGLLFLLLVLWLLWRCW